VSAERVRDVRIEPVDPFDDAAVDAWHGVYAAAEYADRGPEADVWQLEEHRTEAQEVTDRVRRQTWLVRDAATGEPVAAAGLALGLRDNTHLARCLIFVLPHARRSRIGTTLLDLIETEARAGGRNVLNAAVSWPYPLGAAGAGVPGTEFGRRHGFEVALPEVRRRLRLPAELAPLPAEASGYEVRAFTGAIPEEIVDGWAVLNAEIETAAPTGELDLEPKQAAVAEVREVEALVVAQGRLLVNAVALTPAGDVAAYTQMAVPTGEEVAYQWGTMVAEPHRGRRLGLAVKLAALELLQRERPDVRAVTTYNAEANRHMIAVNEALGFEPIERLGQLQKRL